MTARDRDPSQDELLAMAYVDGELDDAARAEFETRLTSEQALLREVSELRKLALIARQVTPREPKDLEWQRLEDEVVHGGGTSLGLLASAVGTLGILGWLCYELVRSDLETVPKAFLCVLLAGLALLFLLVLRARLRTLPHDPYTEVER
jgi:hypothetical protein